MVCQIQYSSRSFIDKNRLTRICHTAGHDPGATLPPAAAAFRHPAQADEAAKKNGG